MSGSGWMTVSSAVGAPAAPVSAVGWSAGAVVLRASPCGSVAGSSPDQSDHSATAAMTTARPPKRASPMCLGFPPTSFGRRAPKTVISSLISAADFGRRRKGGGGGSAADSGESSARCGAWGPAGAVRPRLPACRAAMASAGTAGAEARGTGTTGSVTPCSSVAGPRRAGFAGPVFSSAILAVTFASVAAAGASWSGCGGAVRPRRDANPPAGSSAAVGSATSSPRDDASTDGSAAGASGKVNAVSAPGRATGSSAGAAAGRSAATTWGSGDSRASGKPTGRALPASAGSSVISSGSAMSAGGASTGAACAAASGSAATGPLGSSIRPMILTGLSSRSSAAPDGMCSSARVVWPKNGSPPKEASSGIATKHSGLNPCSSANASASASVSFVTTATCASSPSARQSKTRSATA